MSATKRTNWLRQSWLRHSGRGGGLATALAMCLALGATACGDKAKGESSTETAAGDSSAKAAGSAGKKTGAPAAASDSESATTGIAVEIKDLQFFSPFSDKRSLMSAKKDNDYSTRKKSHHHGVGVVIEATNNSGKMLSNAWFEAELRFTTADGEVARCNFDVDRIGDGYWSPRTNFLSYAPQINDRPGIKKPDWRNESESSDESPWRPGERIRMIGRQDYCAAAALSDVPIEKIEGELVVKALPRFVSRFDNEFSGDDYELRLVDDTVRIRNNHSGELVTVPVQRNKYDKRGIYVVHMESAPGDGAVQKLTSVRLNRSIDTWGEKRLITSPTTKLSLPPSVLNLQLVEVDGAMVHASGNVLIFMEEGKIRHQDMSRRGVHLLAAKHEAIPAKRRAVTFTADELSGEVSDVAIAHFADDTALSKGKRSVAVTWKLKLDGGSIDGRLRSDVEAATKAYDTAQATADAAGEDDKASAKAAAAAAKAKLTAAKTKYKTASGRERGRLAKLFPCKDVQLVTNRGKRKPSNAKEAGSSCKALSDEDSVSVTMHYKLQRYELPVALAFKLGRDRVEFASIANGELAKPDAR